MKEKCEAAVAVGALDPGVPYESRWAPYVRVHGPGQGQFPKGSIRPRGYMDPDARCSLACAMQSSFGQPASTKVYPCTADAGCFYPRSPQRIAMPPPTVRFSTALVFSIRSAAA